MNDEFIRADLLRSDIDRRIDRAGGALVAYYDKDTVDFNVAFTTESMAFGFMSSNGTTAKARISRSTSQSSCKSNLTLEGFLVKL